MKQANSTHLFTSRKKGAADRSIFLLAVLLLTAFTLCSFYAIYQQPTSPASWSMAIFFGAGLILILLGEENVLPNIKKEKAPFAALTWFSAWIFAAFFVSYLLTYNWMHLFMTILFGVLFFAGITYSTTDKEGRKIIRAKTSSGTKKGFNKAFNRKPKTKKPKKKKKSKKKRRIKSF